MALGESIEVSRQGSVMMVDPGPPKALFYSHGTLGLGHLRRTLLICEALQGEYPELSTLVLTGSAMAHAFRTPPGIDYIKLPAVTKIENEHYESRSLRIPFEGIWALRQEIILRTVVEYKPDFFFVDNVPLGMKREIESSLLYLRRERPSARVFLVLRDILDDREELISSWRRLGGYEALEKFYDRIFILGSPNFFDATREYEFPESLVAKSRFCGYIPRPPADWHSEAVKRTYCPNGEKMVLVTLGGGSDGERVVETYLSALSELKASEGVVSVVILGPEMNRKVVKHLMDRHSSQPGLVLLDFCSESLALIEAADCVVSMAGYNTISEIVWLQKRAVVIPRVSPRTEQLIRSTLLKENGVLDMIHPDELTPARLAERVNLCLSSATPPPSPLMKFTGLECLISEVGPMIRGLQVGSRRGVAL